MTQDPELWNWRKSIVEGNPDRRNGSIILLERPDGPRETTKLAHDLEIFRDLAFLA